MPNFSGCIKCHHGFSPSVIGYSYNIGIDGVKIKGQSEKSFVCFQWLVIFIFL